ncbi:MAG: hypothetical protein WBD99_06925 [Thermodesulfobacteriota bacterium]
MYEISRLINQVIGEDRSRKRAMVRGLGFEDDLIEGYNRLENLFRTGRCHEKIRKRLPKTLNLLPKRVKEALEQTAREVETQNEVSRRRREEYLRKTFRPYLWINHIYSRPKNRALVDHIGLEHWKMIDLPKDINETGLDDQVERIHRIIIDHQRETSGYDDMFGRITDYIFCRSYDESYLFTVKGELVSSDNVDRNRIPLD